MLAQNDAISGSANRLRRHDFVAQRVTQHSVLVNASLMRERVSTYYCLVGLRRKGNNGREQLAGVIDLLGAHTGLIGHAVGAHSHRHDDLFQGSISRALADPIDRALHLSGASTKRGKRVGDGESKIVMAVDRDDYVVNAADSLS